MPRRRKTRVKKPDPRYRHLKRFQFKPGQSGNPRGRPKGRKNRVNHELAMGELVRLMESKRTPVALRMKAAKTILEIAWGSVPGVEELMDG